MIEAVKAIVNRRKRNWFNVNLECDSPCGKLTEAQRKAIVTDLSDGLDKLGFGLNVEYDWQTCALVIQYIRLSDGVAVETENLHAEQPKTVAGPKIQVEITTPTSRLPSRQHPDDAGYDLYANEALAINVGAMKLVKCGIKIAIPPGYVGFICPRSGLSLKHGITVLNGPGVIDSGYVGEIGVVLINFGVRNFEVAVGDRIGQIVFIELAKLDLVAGKVDGGRSGGFGSTGR